VPTVSIGGDEIKRIQTAIPKRIEPRRIRPIKKRIVINIILIIPSTCS
jgi:hypothetical protein